MKTSYIFLLLTALILFPFNSSQATDKKTYTINRKGNFDKSSEKLLLRFEKLRYGMTLSTVKKLFPEAQYANWNVRAINRHYAREFCFQWQDEVFFCFTFSNNRPLLDGKYNSPDDDSDDWRLRCAAVIKEKVRVVDGEEVIVKTFTKPEVIYSYQKTKKTEQDVAPDG